MSYMGLECMINSLKQDLKQLWVMAPQKIPNLSTKEAF